MAVTVRAEQLQEELSVGPGVPGGSGLPVHAAGHEDLDWGRGRRRKALTLRAPFAPTQPSALAPPTSGFLSCGPSLTHSAPGSRTAGSSWGFAASVDPSAVPSLRRAFSVFLSVKIITFLYYQDAQALPPRGLPRPPL